MTVPYFPSLLLRFGIFSLAGMGSQQTGIDAVISSSVLSQKRLKEQCFMSLSGQFGLIGNIASLNTFQPQ